MSIQFRLNALIGGLLVAALLSIIVTMIIEAGPRITAENRSIMRLSREFVETSISSLGDMSDPAAGLVTLLDGLKDLRHVRIYLDGRAAPAQAGRTVAEAKRTGLRKWLARLMRTEPDELRVPVDVRGKSLGTIVVASQPGDEINEVSDEIIELAQRGLLLVLALFALTSFVINRALQPVDRLASAMRTMEAGDYDISVPVGGPPEIAVISSRLNDLAGALRRSRSENRWLSQKLIRVEDDERRDLARELHDELGPYLFAVRAGGTSLKREVEKPAMDPAKVISLAATMLEQIDSLQQTNRRVLQRLRPVGLSELGLEATLKGVIGILRKDAPHIEVSLSCPKDLSSLDDTSALTVYRVVQEGLTNAFRHAGATAVEVGIDHVPRPARPAALADRDLLHISVRDDGQGIAKPLKHGHGLTGMSERVWALGGAIEVRDAPGGGALLEAWVPVTSAVTSTAEAEAAPRT